MKSNKIKNFFLNLFFPKKCLGCGKYDLYLCEECFQKISHQGGTCLNYPKESGLNRIISAASYVDPLTRDLIKALKYNFVRELTKPLSELIIKHLESISFASGISADSTILIPIPLHSRRLRERGFNQSELIAQEIADYFHLPIKTDILKRIIFTEPQADIKNIERRKKNIKNAFSVANADEIKDKLILLVDDVITTGATLSDAARILKSNRAKEIWALTVARG